MHDVMIISQGGLITVGYTIKDFIESNQFDGLKIINHAGLDREITGAQIISMIDIENLAGGVSCY